MCVGSDEGGVGGCVSGSDKGGVCRWGMRVVCVGSDEGDVWVGG